MRWLLSIWDNSTQMYVVLWTYVPSLGRNHYFCVLVDDRTHCLWFLPCAKKSDFMLWFICLDTLFANHYQSHTKILQTDRVVNMLTLHSSLIVQRMVSS